MALQWRSSLFAMLVCLSFPASPAQLPSGAQHPAGTEVAEVRAVLTQQQAAWNRGDIDGFMLGYWNSPQLTFAGKTGFTHGWDTVLFRYERDYPDKAAMGRLDFTELEVRQLGPDAALVLGKWHLTRIVGDVGGIFTLVFQRFPEGWRIVHDHTD